MDWRQRRVLSNYVMVVLDPDLENYTHINIEDRDTRLKSSSSRDYKLLAKKNLYYIKFLRYQKLSIYLDFIHLHGYVR